jgi:hypothetical protein
MINPMIFPHTRTSIATASVRRHVLLCVRVPIRGRRTSGLRRVWYWPVSRNLTHDAGWNGMFYAIVVYVTRHFHHIMNPA